MKRIKPIVFLLILIVCTSFSALQAQQIICATNNNVTNNVSLIWTQSSNPCGPFVAYYVFASTSSSGPFTAIDSTFTITDTTFIHTGALAVNANWYYYVVAIYNCVGFVPTPSATIQNAAPAVPTISYVTVGLNFAEIHWDPSPSPQTCFYVIYYDSIRNNSERHDTVWGRFNTTYIDSFFTYNSNLDPIFYTIEANDCCGNNNGIVQPSHRTIFAKSEELKCDGKVQYTWSPYIGWSNIYSYRIFASNNGAPYAKVAELPNIARSFDYSDFGDFDSVCVFVEALNASDTSIHSRSNIDCSRPAVIQQPKFFYVVNATVNDNEEVDLIWVIDTTAEMFRYYIETKYSGQPFLRLFETLVQRPFISEIDTTLDSLSNTALQSYTYRLQSDDSCGNRVKSSEVSTIFLKVTLSNYYEFTLNWTPFDIDYGRVISYDIYRRQNNEPYVFITTVDPNSLEYIDNVEGIVKDGAQYCYKVVAKYNLRLPNGISYNNLISKSNKGCITHRPIVYIPNAFVPEGVNNIFRPDITFNDLTGYSMSIFNRWGEEIFTTSDYASGWDGKKNGKDCPAGGYAYLIQFNGLDGFKNEYKGVVLLVR
jgi:gliding motility-associated-like protein